MVESVCPNETMNFTQNEYLVKRESNSRESFGNRTALLKTVISGLNDYSKVTSKTTYVQLT